MGVVCDVMTSLLRLCLGHLSVPEKDAYWLELKQAQLIQGVGVMERN